MRKVWMRFLIILAFIVSLLELLLTVLTLTLYDRLFKKHTYIGHERVRDSLSIRILKYSTKFY